MNPNQIHSQSRNQTSISHSNSPVCGEVVQVAMVMTDDKLFRFSVGPTSRRTGIAELPAL